jgi:hypothetical protein
MGPKKLVSHANTRSKIAMLFCIAWPLVASADSLAQTIMIRLVDAKTGKPVKDKHVSAAMDYEFSANRNLPLSDKDGVVPFSIPTKARFITLQSGPKVGKEPNRIPYGVCGQYSRMPIENILKYGFVPRNECESKIQPRPKPGEIIYLIQLIPWWTPDFQ